MGSLGIARVAGIVLVLTATAAAQYDRGFRRDLPMAAGRAFDGKFHYCRLMYQRNPYGDGGGWSTDYPSAEINLSIRLSELTKIPVSFDPSGYPEHLIVRITDDELFQCPFIMAQEVGALYLSDVDGARLGEYFRKGGFLWVDDFWGSYAWDIWEGQIRKALPPAEFPMIDLAPDHPLYRTMFQLKGVPQIPSINSWFGMGGGTSERGADSADVHTRAIVDGNNRIMVLMTHNTDVSDSWEREGDDPRYFYRFSVDGYSVGINVLLYAMTH